MFAHRTTITILAISSLALGTCGCNNHRRVSYYARSNSYAYSNPQPQYSPSTQTPVYLPTPSSELSIPAPNPPSSKDSQTPNQAPPAEPPTKEPAQQVAPPADPPATTMNDNHRSNSLASHVPRFFRPFSVKRLGNNSQSDTSTSVPTPSDSGETSVGPGFDQSDLEVVRLADPQFLDDDLGNLDDVSDEVDAEDSDSDLELPSE